jgi:hypothetical protein
MLAPIIDDAHLMDVTALRKIRLLFEDFPRNHCLILVAQPELLSSLALTMNEDLKDRVTYSVLLKKLAPDNVADFVRAELDKAALAHSTFTDDALSLIVRSSEGGLRKARNLCLSALLEAVRDRTRTSSSSRSTASCSSPTGARSSTCRTDRDHQPHFERPTPSQRLRAAPALPISPPSSHRWLRCRWS